MILIDIDIDVACRGSDEPSALASGLVGDMSYVFFVSPDDLDGGLTPPGDV